MNPPILQAARVFEDMLKLKASKPEDRKDERHHIEQPCNRKESKHFSTITNMSS